MLATLDVSKLRTWLKEFAPENMYCAEAKRSGNPPAVRPTHARGSEAVQMRGKKASARGVNRDTHPRARTAMLVTLDVSKLSTWLKALAALNMDCAVRERSANAPGETSARAKIRDEGQSGTRAHTPMSVTLDVSKLRT